MSPFECENKFCFNYREYGFYCKCRICHRDKSAAFISDCRANKKYMQSLSKKWEAKPFDPNAIFTIIPGQESKDN